MGERTIPAKKLFWYVFLASALIQITLTIFLPITGDEAEFFWWGKYPSLTYHDHPPMVGWINYALISLSQTKVVIRFSSVVFTLIIAFAIVDILKRISKDHENTPWLIGAIFLLMPMNLFFDIVTTDVPVAFFMFLSVYAYLRSELSNSEKSSNTLIFISGIFIGLGILSKYFIFLPLLAILMLLVKRRKYFQIVIFILGLLPFLLFHIYSNYLNCWTNFLFNFWHRHERSLFTFEWPFLYLLSCFYIFTPWILWHIAKSYKAHYELNKSIFFLFAVPVCLFGVTSFFSLIGLHYLYGLLGFLVLCLYKVENKNLLKIIQRTAVFSGAHLLLVIVLLTNPLNILNGFKKYDDWSYTMNLKEIVKELNRDLTESTIVSAKGFSPASLIGWEMNQYVPTFGVGSFQGRNDDFFYDFSKTDGMDYRIFTRRTPTIIKYEPYFDSIEIRKFTIDKEDYYYVDGKNFNFDLYREKVLKTIAYDRYDALRYLPPCECEFLEKYNLYLR